MRLPSLPPERGRRARRPTSTPSRASGGSGDGVARRRAHLRGRPCRQQRGRRRGHRPPRAADQRRRRRLVVPELFELLREQRERVGRRRSSRGATCGRSSACCGGARCSACSSTGATAATASRSSCSAPGRRCRPDRRRSPPRPASRILPVAIRRQPDGTLRRRAGGDPIDVASSDPPSSSGRPRRSPTRWPTSIAAAPEQWYSFKPIWPATAAESGRPRAARAGDAGRPAGPGPAGSPRDAGRPESAPSGGGRRVTVRGRGPARGVVAGLPPARGPAPPARRPRAATSGTGWRPSARPRPGATCGASAGRLADVAGAAAPRSGPPPPTRARSSGSSGPRSGTPPATTSRSPGRRRSRPGDLDERLAVETPELVAEAFGAGQGRSSSSGSISARSSCRRSSCASRVGERRRADGDDRRPGAPGLLRADPRRRRRPHRRPARGAPRAARPRSATGRRSGSSATAT